MTGWASVALLPALGVSSAFGAPPAKADANTVVELTYDSVMDMVRPEAHPGIKVHHNLRITISGYRDLKEQRDRSTKGYADKNIMVQVLHTSEADPSYASWKTAPDGRLIRTQSDPQSTRTMTVTLLPDNTCRLDVADQLKPGFKEYAFIRISNHQLGYFSAYRVTDTSCKIR